MVDIEILSHTTLLSFRLIQYLDSFKLHTPYLVSLHTNPFLASLVT